MELQPSFVLSVEVEELGINAGLQVRGGGRSCSRATAAHAASPRFQSPALTTPLSCHNGRTEWCSATRDLCTWTSIESSWRSAGTACTVGWMFPCWTRSVESCSCSCPTSAALWSLSSLSSVHSTPSGEVVVLHTQFSLPFLSHSPTSSGDGVNSCAAMT